MNQALTNCTCYVKHLPQELAFAIRWGAHDPDCPVYRESGDPVDREKDLLVRDMGQQGTLEAHWRASAARAAEEAGE